jgi:chaperone modulatory protein CbpM
VTARDPVRGVILDEETILTLQEVCEVCGVKVSLVIEMVQEGIVEPLDVASNKLEFSGVAVTRLLTAYRLQRDLHVNLPGAALALDLLDEINALRRTRK